MHFEIQNVFNDFELGQTRLEDFLGTVSNDYDGQIGNIRLWILCT